MSKESACNAGDSGDVGLIPGSGRSPGGGYGNPLQYSCLESPMDRGAWRAMVSEATEHMWTAVCQGFEGNGLPVPSPGGLLDPGIEPASLVSPALADGFFTSHERWLAAFF